MKKQVIKLNEAQLNQIISESVRQYLSEDVEEGWGDFFRGAARKVGGDVSRGAQNAYNAGSRMASNAYSTAKHAVGNAYNGVKNYANDVRAAGQQASNMADARSAVSLLQNLIQKGILDARAGRMAIGNLQKYGMN